jgi:Leucine-rich repeat (LRR) protein
MSDIRIPGFEIVCLIGRGGMASVWRARQVSLDREVAIKVLSSHFAADPADVERFQQEAKAAARLKHSGIVQVYDAGMEGGLCYFVMEYVAGYTVGDWVRRKRVLPERDAILVAECVADALDYAWKQAGLIHCDVKPDNIIIDADGTVKLADLGLSRTINAMNKGGVDTDEVMGTPSYIAPEQAMGLPDLDCRADIYSLGAMLYHMATGKRLFEKHPEQDVMEKQCTEQCENPCELNPSLSPGICLLIEHMLEKDRSHRMADWATVREEIARVKAGRPPKCGFRSAVSSTVRHVSRTAAAPQAAARRRGVRRLAVKVFPARWIVLAIAAALLGGAAWWVVRHEFIDAHSPVPASAPVTPAPAIVPAPTPSATDRLRECADLYREAVAWVDNHPAGIEDNRTRLEDVMRKVAGTPYEDLLHERLRVLQQSHTASILKVLAELDELSRPLRQEGRIEEAAALYESYAGPFAEATREQRAGRVAELRAAATPAPVPPDTEGPASSILPALAGRVADLLLADDLQGARDAVKATDRSALAAADQKAFYQTTALLDRAAGVDTAIIESFREQRGSELVVYLAAGPVTVRVREVSADTVLCDQVLLAGSGSASRPVSFGLKDFSVREKLARMGDDARSEVVLMKGVMAFRSHAYSHARKFFATVPPSLSEALLARVDRGEAAYAAASAASETNAVAAPSGVPVPSVPVPTLPRVILPRHLQGIKDNAAAVTALMCRQNPGMSTKAITIESDGEGLPLSASISSSPAVVDLGPLAALTTLRHLSCVAPTGVESGVRDLAPLRGLPLESVQITNCRVADISPLRGMRLKTLNLSGTIVRDLLPLRGMALEELNIAGTSVIDLAAVSAMPLRRLDISDTAVRRLTSVRTMQLERLEMRNCGSMDLGSVAQLQLRWLDISGTSVRSLDAFAAMPLATLALRKTGVSDLSPLTRLTGLHALDIGQTPVSDFTPLKGLKLNWLVADGTKLSDLSVLIGMPLKHLNINGSAVTDLWPLRGMALHGLDIENLGVVDLAPLKAMPLGALRCRGVAANSFAPLHGAPLKALWISDPERHANFIGSLAALTSLNGAVYPPVP